MKIEVEKLSEQAVPFAQSYPAGELDLEDEMLRLTAETRVAGRATRQRAEVKLQGTISTALEVLCDRCLISSPVPIETAFDVSYQPLQTIAVEEAKELTDDDLNLSFYEGDAIDLDELVREQVLLALPSRLLCREECRGLCPTCGVNLNTQPCDCARRETDPRWAALAALKNSDE
ncbi:MAG: DUF177 domain-containing protein [Pyrinomonadaceae bacterium]|nr:DUF177 domain-containing protein [Pyrinomonadaceae bacterium]